MTCKNRTKGKGRVGLKGDCRGEKREREKRGGKNSREQRIGILLESARDLNRSGGQMRKNGLFSQPSEEKGNNPKDFHSL